MMIDRRFQRRRRLDLGVPLNKGIAHSMVMVLLLMGWYGRIKSGTTGGKYNYSEC